MTNKRISKQCLICNSEYTTYKENSKFCSAKCYRVKTFAKVKTNCSQCNKEFLQDGSKFKVNVNNFCDKKCYQLFHAVQRVVVKCNGCGEDKELSTNIAIKYNNGSQEHFYCGDSCRQEKNRVLTCKVCKCDYSSFSYRKSSNEKGFTVIRKTTITCSNKCLIEFYKTDEARKEKISIAFSGEKHPNYINGYSHNHRIRRSYNKETFSKRDKREVFDRFNNKCFKCGNKEDLTVDHHIPFIRSGRLTRSNAVLLCRSCNSSKNAKMPKDFYTEKELKKLDIMGVNENNLFNFIFEEKK